MGNSLSSWIGEMGNCCFRRIDSKVEPLVTAECESESKDSPTRIDSKASPIRHESISPIILPGASEENEDRQAKDEALGLSATDTGDAAKPLSCNESSPDKLSTSYPQTSVLERSPETDEARNKQTDKQTEEEYEEDRIDEIVEERKPVVTIESLPTESIKSVLSFLGVKRIPLSKHFCYHCPPKPEMLLGACKRGYTAYLQMALDINPRALVDVADRCRMTALHHAVFSNNLECVKLVVESSTAAEADTGNDSDLEDQERDEVRLERLSKSRTAIVNAVDVWRCVPLHRARSAEIGRYLLFECGANPNAVTRADVKDTKIEAGESPLHVAVRYFLPDLLAAIVSTNTYKKPKNSTGIGVIKANIDLTNRNGSSPLDVAVEVSSEKCGALLVKNGAQRAVWASRKMTWANAVETRLTFLLEYMKKRGCQSPVNLLRETADTALHLSAEMLYADMTKILLGSKADASIRDKNGQTPLHRATKSGSLDDFLETAADIANAAAKLNASQRSDILRNLTGQPLNASLNSGQASLDALSKNTVLSEEKRIIRLDACLESVSHLLDNNPRTIPMGDAEKRTAVHFACATGSLDLVEMLFAEKHISALSIEDDSTPSGSDSPMTAKLKQNSRESQIIALLSARDINLRTPLHYACDGENCQQESGGRGASVLVKRLISLKADVFAQDRQERTPFTTAVAAGAELVVKSLLEMNEPSFLDQLDQQLQTPLMLACGYPNIVKILVEKYSAKGNLQEMLHLQDWEGRMAMHIASQRGNKGSLDVLIEAGGNIHERMDWGWTCLMLAADTGHLPCVQLLLEKQADLTLRRSDGATAGLVLARTNQLKDGKDMIDVLKLLMKYDSRKDGKSETDGIGMQDNIIHDTELTSGRQFLHFAAGNAFVEKHKHLVLQFLLENGADVNKKDSCCWTALHYACQRGDVLSVEMLLKNGAVDSPDDCGMTARDLSEKCGHHVLLNLFPQNVQIMMEKLAPNAQMLTS